MALVLRNKQIHFRNNHVIHHQKNNYMDNHMEEEQTNIKNNNKKFNSFIF